MATAKFGATIAQAMAAPLVIIVTALPDSNAPAAIIVGPLSILKDTG